MELRVGAVDFFVTGCRTRLPFRFGVVTMTRAPLLVARVGVRSEAGVPAEGFASDLLVPKWFDKDAARPIADDFRELAASARAAAAVLLAPGAGTGSAFELWWRLYRARVVEAREGAALVRGFGVALLERALLDAACRAAGRSFFEALRGDLFGFAPERVHPELAGLRLRDSLPAEPLPDVLLRHTVGLADPLRAGEIPAAERLDDGLPQALDENVARYGLRCFKIKLAGDPDADLARLLGVARVVAATAAGPARFTLDGNEQYRELRPLAEVLERAGRDPDGRGLVENLLYVEQPLPRARSLDPAAAAELAAVAGYAPLLLDEADAGIGSFPAALALGYRGVSVKNCKGVFRALLNRGLCERHGDGAFQASEDLTNLPVLALQQDLATVAALGLPHAERNGHHYFRGLDHLPPGEARDALRAHPDLYAEGPAGIALRIEDGRLALGSLQRPGYGYDLPIRVAERTPLAQWKPESAA